MMLVLMVSSCGSPNSGYSERYASYTNAKMQGDDCYREATRNPNVQKIDREVIPDVQVLTLAQISAVKNTDKKITPEQKSALIVYDNLLSNCDAKFVNALKDDQQRRITYAKKSAVEQQRSLLIAGEITIKEFNRRFDQIKAGTGANYQDIPVSTIPYGAGSLAPIILPPRNTSEIKSMGEPPAGYTNQNTNPWQSKPAVNCTPTTGGGFVCQ